MLLRIRRLYFILLIDDFIGIFESGCCCCFFTEQIYFSCDSDVPVPPLFVIDTKCVTAQESSFKK